MASRRKSSAFGLGMVPTRRKSSVFGLEMMDCSEPEPVAMVTTSDTTDSILLVKDLERKVRECRLPGSMVPRLDKEFLLKFLRTKDFKLEESFEALKSYYTCVYRNFDIIKGVHASDITLALNSGTLTVLKHSAQQIRVIILRIKFWKPKQVELRHLQLAFVYIIEQLTAQAQVQENGVSLIFDCDGLSLEHIRNFSVKELRRNIQVVMEGLPIRARSVHFLNPPRLFWPFYKLTMQFLKEKMRQRVHLHYKLQTLHEAFPKELLPQFLDGNLDNEEALDTHLVQDLLQKDTPLEEYWNGGIGKPNLERRFSRKRSIYDMYTN